MPKVQKQSLPPTEQRRHLLRVPIAIGPVPTGQDCLNEHVLERAEVNESCIPDDPNPDCQPIDPNHPGRWYLPPLGHGLSDLARLGRGN